MPKTFKSVALLAIAAISLSSCMTLQPIEFKSAGPLNFTGDLKNPELTFDIILHNPNNWGVKLSRTSIKVLMNDQQMAAVNNTRKVKLKAKSNSTIPMTIKLSGDELAKTGLGGLLKGRKPSFNLKGEVAVSKWWIRKKFSFDAKDLLTKGFKF